MAKSDLLAPASAIQRGLSRVAWLRSLASGVGARITAALGRKTPVRSRDAGRCRDVCDRALAISGKLSRLLDRAESYREDFSEFGTFFLDSRSGRIRALGNNVADCLRSAKDLAGESGDVSGGDPLVAELAERVEDASLAGQCEITDLMRVPDLAGCRRTVVALRDLASRLGMPSPSSLRD